MGNSLFDSGSNNASPTVPIVYSSDYNIGFMKLETLHPFDSRKYEKIYESLIEHTNLTSSSFIKPSCECSTETLHLVHSNSYLDTLNKPENVAKLVEVPPVSYLPNIVVQKYLLAPMRYACQGSIESAKLALCDYGWAINLSGGYHHASAEHGGGFCVYADISLVIADLMQNYSDSMNLTRIMIIDLDAHQGNGHERDKADGLYKEFGADVFIVDFYNEWVYPHDFGAKKGIDFDGTLDSKANDKTYLDKLHKNIPGLLDSFKPQFVIYNAGTDILSGDPLGDMRISENGVIQRDEFIFDECLIKRKIPVVMLLSGGYQSTNAGVITNSILNLDKKFDLFKVPCKDTLFKSRNQNDEEKQSDVCPAKSNNADHDVDRKMDEL